MKLLISLAVFFGDEVRNGVRRLFGLERPPSCVVLYYHSVMDEQRHKFARQMDTIVRQARPLRADGPIGLESGTCYFAITFDDANANIITNALPALKERDIPTTLFVIGDRLGVIPDWENFEARRKQGQGRVIEFEGQIGTDTGSSGAHVQFPLRRLQ